MAVRNSRRSMQSAKIGNQDKSDVWLVEWFRAGNYLYTMSPFVHWSGSGILIDIFQVPFDVINSSQWQGRDREAFAGHSKPLPRLFVNVVNVEWCGGYVSPCPLNRNQG